MSAGSPVGELGDTPARRRKKILVLRVIYSRTGPETNLTAGGFGMMAYNIIPVRTAGGIPGMGALQPLPGQFTVFSVSTGRVGPLVGQAKEKNYSTQYSRVVPHRSTDWAITSLTSEIRRDPVLPSVYGRS